MQYFRDMEKLKIYKLIDSLTELLHCPPESIAENIVNGLNSFLEPKAVYIFLDIPGKGQIENFVGDLTHKPTLIKYRDQLKEMAVESADFNLSTGEREIISCTVLRQPQDAFGTILVVSDNKHELKHIIRQILDLYKANLLLLLTLSPQSQSADLPSTLNEAFKDLENLGVDWVLGIDQASPATGYLVDSRGSRNLGLNKKIQDLIKKGNGNPGTAELDEIKKLLSGKVAVEKLMIDNFDIGKSKFRCVIGGNYRNNDVVISRFKSKLTDLSQPSGYDEVIEAFKRLKEDHKLIVKGERIAAILETAVALNHEINNPLTAVLGNTQLLLLQKDKLSNDVVAKITTIEKSALRIREVTQKLMKIVEPITTNYTNNLDMLDIEKSAGSSKATKE